MSLMLIKASDQNDESVISSGEVNEHDMQLLMNIASGDCDSFSLLMNRYQQKMKNFLRSYIERLEDSADDILQDVFLEIYLSAHRFNNQSKVSTWIYSVAKFTVYNKLRKQKRFKLVQYSNSESDALTLDAIDASESPESLLSEQQSKQIIHECMSQLDSKSYELLYLFEFVGLSYQDISDKLNVKVGTVRSRLFYARAKLSRLVKQTHNGQKGES